MSTLQLIVVAYVVIMSIVAFIFYGVDKAKAKAGAWRIPEKTLLLLAAVGGSFGAFAGMQIFRHKTKHPQFYITVPVCMVIHIVILFFLFK